MSEKRRNFSVIINEKLEHDAEKRITGSSYQTNPLGAAANPLKEKLMRHVNEEGGRKFTVEDLLKW